MRLKYYRSLLIVTAIFGLLSCQSSTPKLIMKPFNGFANKNISKITVIAIPSEHIDPRRVEHIFYEQLYNKGYRLTSRTDLDIILKEMKLQRSKITTSRAAEIGRIMNVDAVLISSVTGFRKQRFDSSSSEFLAEAVVDARLIQVEDGSIIWVSSRKFQSNLFSQLGSVYRDPINNPPWSILTNTGNRLAPLVQELADIFPNYQHI